MPKRTRDLRASVWTYVFERYEAKKKAGDGDAGQEAKGTEHEVRPRRSIRPPRN